MRKLIKGSRGETLGYEDDNGNTKSVSNASGKYLGRYDKEQDRTFDRQGRNVGTTDQTRNLLED